jgi:hypothetical protein
MKTLFVASLVSSLVCLAGLRAAEPATNPAWGKAADNKIVAQQLVNQLIAAHPELVVVGIHAPRPGETEGRMIATNLDRIGKEDDEDDKAVATEGRTILEQNLKEPRKFEVLLPLKDATGKTIGALGLVFDKTVAGDSHLQLFANALAMRDALARKIPTAAAMFAPAR